MELRSTPTIARKRLDVLLEAFCIPMVIGSMFLGEAAVVKAQAFYDSSKVITEGGMRFSKKDQDAIRMSSLSTSGLRVAGSAAVPGGNIKVGSAASEVISELNPLEAVDGGVSGNLFVAGDPAVWAPTHQLQRALPTGSDEVVSRRISRGAIDPRLLLQLKSLQPAGDTQPNSLIQAVQLRDTRGNILSNKAKFSSDYDNLQLLLSAKNQDGLNLTRGTHIISYSKEPSGGKTPHFILDRRSTHHVKVWAGSSDRLPNQVAVAPTFVGYSNSTEAGNPVQLQNLQSSGGNYTNLRYTILGFSKNPNPNDGKKSVISAFATNNRSVGSINVKRGQTLADLAALYGTTIESLMQANNLPSADVDLSNLSLVIPADLSTIGFETTLDGETASMVAKRFEVDVAWLLDLNGLSDPGQILPSGTKLRIPGRRPLGSPILPPAKPMKPELEYADYGAYTTYEVTYDVRGSITPLFAKTLIDSFR